MKRLIALLLILSFTACSPLSTAEVQSTIAQGMVETRAAEPTSTPTPEPTPDIEATIQAGIAATQAAQPSNTPMSMPSSTATNTPELPADSAQSFFVKYREKFEESKVKMSEPINASFYDIYLDQSESGGTWLYIKTTGIQADIDANLMGFSIGVLSGLLVAQKKEGSPNPLPPDLEKVYFSYLDKELVEKGFFRANWTDFQDYADEKIAFMDLFNAAEWTLP